MCVLCLVILLREGFSFSASISSLLSEGSSAFCIPRHPLFGFCYDKSQQKRHLPPNWKCQIRKCQIANSFKGCTLVLHMEGYTEHLPGAWMCVNTKSSWVNSVQWSSQECSSQLCGVGKEESGWAERHRSSSTYFIWVSTAKTQGSLYLAQTGPVCCWIWNPRSPHLVSSPVDKGMKDLWINSPLPADPAADDWDSLACQFFTPGMWTVKRARM